MMEFVLLGVTLVLVNVLTMLVTTYLTFKILFNKKLMLKFTKRYMKYIEEITNGMEDLLEDEAE